MWPPLPLSCLTRLDVSATNWLPTGIQGAKEPLDGQRLEVYPGINVSKSVCDTQESTLFIRSRHKGARQIPSLPTSVHLSVHSSSSCKNKLNFLLQCECLRLLWPDPFIKCEVLQWAPHKCVDYYHFYSFWLRLIGRLNKMVYSLLFTPLFQIWWMHDDDEKHQQNTCTTGWQQARLSAKPISN